MWRRRVVWPALRLAAIALCVVPSQLGAPPSALASTPAERGKIFVQRNCAKCHAIGSTGASPRKQAPPFRTLYQRYDVGDLAEAFAEGIGVHDSTAQNDTPQLSLEPEEIDDLIAYLRSVQPRQASR
jgi:mono/diheme cytochrome c family protein